MRVRGKEEFDAREDVAQFLFLTARAGHTITYKSLWQRLRLSPFDIGNIVGNVSEWTYANWRVYLSAIVVQKPKTRRPVARFPGGGFFGLSGHPPQYVRSEERWGEKLSSQEKALAWKCQQEVFSWARRRKRI